MIPTNYGMGANEMLIDGIPEWGETATVIMSLVFVAVWLIFGKRPGKDVSD